MAKSKSIPNGKTKSAGTEKNPSREVASAKQQASPAIPASLPEVKAVAVEAASSTLKLESNRENKTAPELRKREATKAETRKNLFPINLDDEIRRRAYELYEQRGNSGSEADDWLTAEREVLQRYQQNQHSA